MYKMILGLFAAGGLGWGFFSLLLALSRAFAESTGLLRVVLIALSSPYHLAAWLGATLQLPVVDPTGLVVGVGLLMGLGLALAVIVVHWGAQ